MKLVVGLGNPGKQYEGTRHNVGFEVITELARRYDVGRPKAKFNAELAEAFVNSEKTVLMCPLTFMNLSGRSVGEAVEFFKLPLDDLIVICDDLNLPVARLRMRPGGSAGGQNGLKDIIARLGSQDFCRLRIGIDRPPGGRDSSDWVLGRFDDQQKTDVKTAITRAADAVECWIASGTGEAMSRFNPDPEEVKQRAEKKRLADLRLKEMLEKKERLEKESESVEAAQRAAAEIETEDDNSDRF